MKDGVVRGVGLGQAIITVEATNGMKEYAAVAVTKKAPVTLSNWRYKIDSACGVEWHFNVKNNTNKTIHYVNFRWATMNAVGDPIQCEIQRSTGYSLRYTGPLNAYSTDYNLVNTTRFYNCSYDHSYITRMEVEFADGTLKPLIQQILIITMTTLIKKREFQIISLT